jgi:hypothetical protein
MVSPTRFLPSWTAITPRSRAETTLEGDQIAFSATNAEGTIDYQGRVEEEGLLLQVYSRINGHQDEERYLFLQVFPALFEGEPVTVRVRCTDALRFADGSFSDVQEWVFFLRAPAGWVYAPALQERVTRLAARLYGGLNWHTGLHPRMDDGSRYILGGVEMAILDEEETQKRPWRGQPFYQLQPGEALKPISG